MNHKFCNLNVLRGSCCATRTCLCFTDREVVGERFGTSALDAGSRAAAPTSPRARCGGCAQFDLGLATAPGRRTTDPVLTPRLLLTPVGPDDVDDLVLLSSDVMVAY
jgi:hypothetical protein